MQPTKDFDRYKWMKEPIINFPTFEIPMLSWDGFNIRGDTQSIEEVKKLIEYRAERGVRKSAIIPPKKLTFDEWCYTMPTTDWKNLCSHGYVEVAAAAWKAAQQNV